MLEILCIIIVIGLVLMAFTVALERLEIVLKGKGKEYARNNTDKSPKT